MPDDVWLPPPPETPTCEPPPRRGQLWYHVPLGGYAVGERGSVVASGRPFVWQWINVSVHSEV